MQFSSRILSALILAITLVTLGPPQIDFAQTAAQQQGPLPSSLAWHAALAKARGQTTLTVGPMNVGNDYTPALRDTIKNSLLVRGVVTSTTLDYSDGFKIYRWYRIRPIQKGREPAHKSKVVSPEIPTRIGPARSGELLLRVNGGTATIDGVTITQIGPPPLLMGQEYLFFLEPTDAEFYEIAFQTKPTTIDGKGNLVHSASDHSKFTKQISQFHSFADIQRLTKLPN